MSLMLDEDGKRVNPNATSRIVRKEYLKYPALSYAEVADMAGVGVKTVYKWVREGCIPVVNRVGAFRLSNDGARKFIRTGIKAT